MFASRFRLALLLVLAVHAWAEDASTTNEFWPEANLFLRVHPNFRLIFDVKRERDAEFRNIEVGGDIEFSVHRFRARRGLPWLEQDATRRTLISIRAGYKYKKSFDSTPPAHENRPEVEFTMRWIFMGKVLVSNRARWEFRLVSGSPYSWRYRDQIKTEKDFRMRSYTFTSYIAAESFYNSKKDTWDRFRFSGGAVFPISKSFSLEPYYIRQVVADSQPRFTNALGLVAAIHLPRPK
jgi:hypothetical protein